MSVKHLIFGDGYLGNRLNGYLKDSTLTPKRIESREDAYQQIREHQPENVINCIGKTGRPNIDWCEAHKPKTMHSNAVVPALINQACVEEGVKMVQLGSGCVYEGDNGGRGFTEEDEPNFTGSFYSRTKIISEKILNEFPALQLRIRMPLDSIPHPRNLIDKILGYDKVVVTPNSITVVDDMLPLTEKLIESGKTGIYNVVAEGALTHEEIITMYEELSGVKHPYEKIDGAQLRALTATGRSNCVLSTRKLKKEGFKLKPAKQAVRDCLTKYVENKK